MEDRGNAKVFLDTNIIIRLHVSTAPQHLEVTQAVRSLLVDGREIWISRQILREYAAVLTRPQPYTTPVFPAEVAKQLRQFEISYRITDENVQVTTALCSLLETVPLGGNQVHDANIVASMQAFSISDLFTLNTVDFARFATFINIITLEELLRNDAK